MTEAVVGQVYLVTFVAMLVGLRILAALGASLVLIAVLIADRIGKTIVKPVYELSASAEKLGAGDLAARVTPSGPPEVRAMGVEGNRNIGWLPCSSPVWVGAVFLIGWSLETQSRPMSASLVMT